MGIAKELTVYIANPGATNSPMVSMRHGIAVHLGHYTVKLLVERSINGVPGSFDYCITYDTIVFD